MPDQTLKTGLFPYLTMKDAAAAIEFYKQAFGAQEADRHYAPGTERIMHVKLWIDGNLVMLADDFPEFCGGQSRTPEALGGSPITLHLQTTDADAMFAKAVTAGATVVMPMMDQFWGDRYGQVKDPFGYNWAMAHTVHKLSREEVEEGAKEAFSHTKL